MGLWLNLLFGVLLGMALVVNHCLDDVVELQHLFAHVALHLVAY